MQSMPRPDVRMGKHVGIVGVSAEGAALCYRTMCAEGEALFGRHGHPEVSMHTHPLAVYMPSIDAGRWDAVGQLLLSSASKLVAAGAEVLVCPDNTVHQAVDLIRHESPAPWLHIAEEVANVAEQRRYRRLGILGTRYLMDGPVYPAKLGPREITWEIPGAEDRERVNAIIFDELVRGVFRDASRTAVHAMIARLAGRGCDAVVLGCTELPLLVAEAESPLPVIDSTRTLARAALRHAAPVSSTTS